MPNSTTAVLILFFEKPEQTIECVQSFLPSGCPIYVLNNGSSAHSTRLVDEFCAGHSEISIWTVPHNIGVAAGRNLLVSRTQEPWVFFVDSDAVVITSDWRTKLETHIAANPAIEAYTPKIFNVHDSSEMYWGNVVIEDGRLWQEERQSPCANIFPGTAVVKRSLFERLGGFDEAMFVGYEDLEIAVRALMAGFPVQGLRIDDIRLNHEHRIAYTPEDRKAIRTRYRLKSNEGSFAYLLEKYRLRWVGTPISRWCSMQRGIMAGGRVVRLFWALACWYFVRFGRHRTSRMARP